MRWVRRGSSASGIPATNQPVWERQNWCQTRRKTLKSHQDSMQNDPEQSPPLSQCRAAFSADSEFSHSASLTATLCHLHSVGSSNSSNFPLPFSQPSGFRNAAGESFKERQLYGYFKGNFRRQSMFAPEYSRVFCGESALVIHTPGVRACGLCSTWIADGNCNA